MRRGLPRLADVKLQEEADGSFKLKILPLPPRAGGTTKPAAKPAQGKTGKGDATQANPKVSYTLGMVYAAEKDAVIRRGVEMDSSPVRVSKSGPDLVLQQDELVQVRVGLLLS